MEELEFLPHNVGDRKAVTNASPQGTIQGNNKREPCSRVSILAPRTYVCLSLCFADTQTGPYIDKHPCLQPSLVYFVFLVCQNYSCMKAFMILK